MCPGQPCLTILQYAEQPATYFLSGAVFVFLAGKHIPCTTITLMNTSNITFRGELNDSNASTIMCHGNLSIMYLTFSQSSDPSLAMATFNSESILISNVRFEVYSKQ